MSPDEDSTREVAEARRRFDETCAALRPELHRFCARMTGDPCDGEDVLQDALVLAFYRLPELRDGGSFKAWLFRIAHNKCIDFLRGRKRHEELDPELGAEREPTMDQELDDKHRVERMLATVVTDLQPKERACVILKDVLDWSLEDTAEITQSSVGSVKAALHRGRSRLKDAETTPEAHRAVLPAGDRAVVDRYIAAFNRRDWDGVTALLSREARLEVVHRFEGPFRDASYFVNYGRMTHNWKIAVAQVDGIERVVQFLEIDGAWVPHSIVQLRIDDGRITLVRDYTHVEYLLRHSVVV